MTLAEIRTLLVSVDPNIQHYFSVDKERDYTYWEETQRLPMIGDDEHEDAWRFYVHRFTKDEYDRIAALMFNTLDHDPRVTVIHTLDFEETSGFIHHVFECEGY